MQASLRQQVVALHKIRAEHCPTGSMHVTCVVLSRPGGAILLLLTAEAGRSRIVKAEGKL